MDPDYTASGGTKTMNRTLAHRRLEQAVRDASSNDSIMDMEQIRTDAWKLPTVIGDDDDNR